MSDMTRIVDVLTDVRRRVGDLETLEFGDSAADILAKLKTVDGTMSGLDADMVDGLHALDLGKLIAANGWSGVNYFQPSVAAGTFSVLVTGASGAARDIFRASQVGYSDGFTVQYTGSAMRYSFLGGNVGIGTASPDAPLDLVGSLRLGSSVTDSTDKYSYVRSRHYTNAEEDFLAFFGGSSSTQNFAWFGGGSGAYNAATYLAFYTATNNTTLTGTERLRIDSNGNVGIGTTTPARQLEISRGTAADGTGELLISRGSGHLDMFLIHVGAKATGSWPLTVDSDVITFQSTGSSAMHFAFAQGNTERMRIQNNGYVGINTASPGNLLEVYMTSGAHALRLNSNFGGGNYVDLKPYIYGVSNAGFSLALNGTDRLALSSSGNLGIGVTSPQAITHAHDGTGGYMFVSKAAIAGTAVTLVPNGTGDCTRRARLIGVGYLSDGSTFNLDVSANAGGGVYNVTIGSHTLTFRVQADGTIDVYRSAGSSYTFTINGVLIWQ